MGEDGGSLTEVIEGCDLVLLDGDFDGVLGRVEKLGGALSLGYNGLDGSDVLASPS